MALLERLYSWHCAKPFKRSKLKQKQQPTTSKLTDRTLSDTTESETDDASAAARRKECQDLNTTIPDIDIDIEHTVTLSLLDQGMPRHYTRFCLGFPLRDTSASVAIARLEAFFRRTFQAQPWLAGYACPVPGHSPLAHQLEIRFSQRHVENFPVKVQELPEDKFPLTYDELAKLGMPPSKIPRDLISSCPDRRPDTEPALILDVTVNIIRGGLLIAIFLHHGVTDGASMGTIISGELCRHITEITPLTPKYLAAKAEAETQARLPLSRFPAEQTLGTHLEYRPFLHALNQTPLPCLGATPPPFQVTSRIFRFSESTLQGLKADLNTLLSSSSHEPPWITTHDALQSLLWQHLTRSRLASLTASHPHNLPQTSSLLIPVNMRKRISPPLPSTYLGGAVALAVATIPVLSLLSSSPHKNNADLPGDSGPNAYLLPAAILIHHSISRCQDSYLREVLALTARQGSARNMVDLNIDTASALDLCITSWAVLPVFDGRMDEPVFADLMNDAVNEHADGHVGSKKGRDKVGAPAGRDGGHRWTGGILGMGLGSPDFMRKPWSRDAGGCIILPRDRRRGRSNRPGPPGEEPGFEVLVQLKTEDMETLMADQAFMHFVDRVVD